MGDGDYARLGVVDVLALECHFADRLRRQLAVYAGCGEQLGTVGKELRRAALLGFDVGSLGADYAVLALAQRGQGQGAGGGAVEGEEHLAVSFEQVAEVLRRTFGPLVVAVGPVVAVVGLSITAMMAKRGTSGYSGLSDVTCLHGYCGYEIPVTMEDKVKVAA